MNWRKCCGYVSVVVSLIGAAHALLADQNPQSDVTMPSFLRAELAREHVGLDVDSLLSALSHKSSTVRWIAAREMGVRGVGAAVPKLKALLDDKDRVVRSSAAEALLELGDHSGIPTLKALLDCPHTATVLFATRVLAAHGDDSGLDRIRPLLGCSEVGNRLDALRAFAASQNPKEAYPALRQGVGDSDELVRSNAFRLLTEKGTAQAAEILGGVLDSPSPKDRRRAALSLNWMHKADAVPCMIGALTNDDAEVRRMAVAGLNHLAGRSSSVATDASVRTAGDAKRVQQEWMQWWEANKGAVGANSKVPVLPSKE